MWPRQRRGGRSAQSGTRYVDPTDAATINALCAAANADAALIVEWDWTLSSISDVMKDNGPSARAETWAELSLVAADGTVIWSGSVWVKPSMQEGLVAADGPGNGAMILQQQEWGEFAGEKGMSMGSGTLEGLEYMATAFASTIPLAVKEFTDQAESALASAP